ncbi:hypothetical protein ACQ86N_31410 [Puia sp. P3]|uniref:hypothetical protein n=1 Tax=Puia sp. P3 TaxID=3423952 RepID=UPI003D6733B5
MRKALTLLTAILTISVGLLAQNGRDTAGKSPATPDNPSATTERTSVYTLHPKVDIPLIAASAAWDIYGFSQISKKDGLTEAEVLAKDKNKINWFDRWAVHPYSHSIDRLSYIPFYVAVPLPSQFSLSTIK